MKNKIVNDELLHEIYIFIPLKHLSIIDTLLLEKNIIFAETFLLV